jgi:hypothetical protein
MTESQYRAGVRATRAALIEERDNLEPELLTAKTRAKYDYIYKKGERLTARIHFLSEELGELCPDCNH